MKSCRTRWITAVLSASAAAFTALHGLAATLLRNARTVLADYSRDQQAKAVELIEDGAIQHLRGRIYLAVSSDGSEVYRTSTAGVCNCPAGLKSRRCFHTLAARLAEVA